MRRPLLIWWTFFSLPFWSQVVFCPPGAEWHYSFVPHNLSPPPKRLENVSIKYDHDSILGTDTVKVLIHDRYFREFNDLVQKGKVTLIKQTGDIVFFRSAATNHIWEILFNFAITPGFCWQTTVKGLFGFRTYTYCLDSVKFISHKGQLLKTLYLNDDPNFYITERFGPNSFLFYFPYHEYSDGDYFEEFLCYQDSAFGIKQFGPKPCDFSNPVGIIEQTSAAGLSLFPNPTSDHLNVSFSGSIPLDFLNYSITDNLGRNIQEEDVQSRSFSISTSTLAPGLYVINLTTQFGTLTKKFVKAD